MEDAADWLYACTTWRLLTCLGLISVKQYVFSSIACVSVTSPGSGMGGWINYMDNFCWIDGTISIKEKITSENWDELPRIGYYQWIPFILLLQTLLFYLPRRLWQKLQHNTEDDLNIYKNYILHRPSFYLVVCHLCVKGLCICICIAQLIFLEYLFGIVRYQLVIQVLKNKETVSFPRVAYCQLNIKELGTPNNQYTAQCVLPLNMLNEKIFLCIWFWLIILIFILVMYCLKWVYHLCFSKFYKKLCKGVGVDAIFIFHMLSKPKADELYQLMYD